MSGKVLYRKYRPTKLTDVVGQPQVTDALQNRIKQGNIGHAYLFIGPRGTGKTSVARIFAHAVNDFPYQVEDNYLDIIEIDAASNTGVDNIRELREKAAIAPTKGKYKVYIIDEVHMLTKSASNALLKTLEEPPNHVIFIMATTDAHKVPITISSRTQVFTFRLSDADTMLSYLRKIADLEKIPITDDALKIIVHRGGGSFRDSMSLLDQVTTLTDTEITAEILEHALGLPQDQSITNLLTSYAAGDTVGIQQTFKELLNTGIKPEIIASELISHILDHPDPAWLPLLKKLPDVQPPFPEARLLVALMSKVPATATPPSITATPATSQSTSTEPGQTGNTTSTAPQPASSPAESATPKPTRPASKPAPKIVTVPPPTSADAPSDQPTLAPQPPSSPDQFDWEVLLDAVHRDSGAVYQQLLKTDYELIDDTLHLYPANKFAKTILDKPNHRQIITDHLGNLSFVLHEVGAKQPPKDSVLSKISDIMGAEIREVTEDSPF